MLVRQSARLNDSPEVTVEHSCVDLDEPHNNKFPMWE